MDACERRSSAELILPGGGRTSMRHARRILPSIAPPACTDAATALREARPADMFTEEQLRAYLEHLSPNREFLKFHFADAERFVVHVRCDIDKNKPPAFYDAYIDKWIKSFSKFTATTWNARVSYAKRKTLLLQKNFFCRPVDCTKRKGDDGTAECGAQIEFKVKLINGNDDLNVFILVHFEHSHAVYTPAALLADSLSDTDKRFFEYFDNGFNATTSKTYHELSIIEKFGGTCARNLGDRETNPPIERIKYLIDKMQSKEIKRSFNDILQAKKAFIKDSGGTLAYSEDPEIVVIVTPMMKRVLLKSDTECVLVDSSRVKIGLVVTFFYISNKIGALPVACVLHAAATESNFREAFHLLKLTVHSVNESFSPKTFIVNDLVEQKKALAAYFPESRMLLSRWSICAEIWKWLCNDDLKIDHRRRHSLMFLFRSLIYADADDAHAHYTKLIVSDYFDSKLKLREYIDYLWRRSKEWMVHDEYKLHHLTEVSVRLLKEFMLRKCRFFNIIMMIDVVSKLLENHLKSLINTYIDGMPKTSNYTKFFHRSYSSRSSEDFVQIRLNEYMVQYRSSPNLYYHVKTDTMCCDCAIGEQGRLCDHLGIIFNKGSARVLKIPLLTNTEVDLLIKFTGLSDDNTDDKCEMLDDEDNADPVGGAASADDTVYLNKYQRDCVKEVDEHIQKHATYADVKPPNFYVLKKINRMSNIKKCIKKAPDIVQKFSKDDLFVNRGNGEILPTPNEKPRSVEKRKVSPIEFYMKSLTQLNEQFQKLINYFQKNPNTYNIDAMDRLSKHLDKIKPHQNPEAAKVKKRKPND
ncbi:unnamed protein product [Leptosia nina]|uniref:SWIM-type domain-containing protein n=1 Tax=Leptosia nina TaxID=320188 RepID=A0AAV1JUR4_9NEOP